MQQQTQTPQKQYIYHVYREEVGEEEEPTVEAEPEEPEREQQNLSPLTMMSLSLVALLCIGIPVVATLLGQVYPNTYDTTISKTITLALSLEPSSNQVPLFALPAIKKTEQLTVNATGTIHQNATRAEGLITFYNGLFTSQTVPAGTTLTGKDGVSVISAQTAVIPAATPTTPPTYGTVSVTAVSNASGSLGNIAANDIDSACCSSSILAQNLYAFSGGQDARDIPVLTKTDISQGTQTLLSQASTIVGDQAQTETKPGFLLLPLNCSQILTANHQPGEQASSAILTLKETCTPLAYKASDIAMVSQHFFTLPRDFHLVPFTALVLASHTTPTGGTLTVHAIAYLKQERITVQPYRFPGK